MKIKYVIALISIFLIIFTVGCSSQKEQKKLPDFSTLCASDDVTHLNNMVEQHLRYTFSINETLVWLNEQQCIESAIEKVKDSMEIRFNFNGEKIYLRIKVITQQAA